MQCNGKASGNGRTLKMVSFLFPLCPFVLHGLAVIEIARDKEWVRNIQGQTYLDYKAYT